MLKHVPCLNMLQVTADNDSSESCSSSSPTSCYTQQPLCYRQYTQSGIFSVHPPQLAADITLKFSRLPAPQSDCLSLFHDLVIYFVCLAMPVMLVEGKISRAGGRRSWLRSYDCAGAGSSHNGREPGPGKGARPAVGCGYPHVCLASSSGHHQRGR